VGPAAMKNASSAPSAPSSGRGIAGLLAMAAAGWKPWRAFAHPRGEASEWARVQLFEL